MPASASFLATALAAIQSSAPYAAFQAALAALSAAPEDSRQAAWNRCYADAQLGLSPAYQLRRSIRDAIANTEASTATALSPTDTEAAYQLLVAQIVPDGLPPAPATVMTPALTQEDVDLFRAAMGRLASD